MVDKARAILVVDDDADIRDAIRDTLEQEGYATAEAASGADALHYLATHPRPAVVLLDWNMAPMSGADFMAALSLIPALASVPVVLLTADARVAEDGSDARRFAAFVKKPVKLEVLFATIERYFR